MANVTTLTNANSLKWELPALYTAAILRSSQIQDTDHHISTETAALLQKEVENSKGGKYCIAYLKFYSYKMLPYVRIIATWLCSYLTVRTGTYICM